MLRDMAALGSFVIRLSFLCHFQSISRQSPGHDEVAWLGIYVQIHIVTSCFSGLVLTVRRCTTPSFPPVDLIQRSHSFNHVVHRAPKSQLDSKLA